VSAKHTPGPWRFAAGETSGGFISTEKGHHIGTVTNQWGADTCIADCRLIATAPELLEACKAVLEHWDTIYNLDAKLAAAQPSRVRARFQRSLLMRRLREKRAKEQGK